MRRHVWIWLAGLLATVVAAVPAAAAQDGPVVRSVTKRVAIREGGVAQSTVRCPRRMVAVAGTVAKQPSGSTLRRSLPSGVRTWRFAFGGNASAGRASVTVRCLALGVPPRAGKVRLNVNTVRRTVGVSARRSGEIRLACRAGYVPTDWGYELQSADTAPPEELHFYKAIADSSGYVFGLENLGVADQKAELRIQCLERRTAGKAGLSHSWRIKVKSSSDRIGAGATTLRHSCPRGYLSLGPGHSLDPAGDGVFRRSYDVRTGSARWAFDNGPGSDRVTTQLLCLSGRTRFR